MKKITIYSSLICPYCIAAKKLLISEGLGFDEIIIDNKPELKDEMIKKTNGNYTVPQIFFDDELIGGFDQLSILNKNKSIKSLIED
ncbi:glutaredoxin 3 [Rickettsiales bacterium]|nr:glutaredoxin 3 [Rickettsiales bacterium]